jgi:hypothetical protein
MGFLNALRSGGSDAIRESASLTTAYLLEQNRKFEGFIREKISTLESRVNVQRSRLSLKVLEEEEPGDELELSGSDGHEAPEPARPEPEVPYPGAWDMVDFRDLSDLSGGVAAEAGRVDDIEASLRGTASLDDQDAADASPAGEPVRAAAEAQREPIQPEAPPDWMSALIGAPAAQPSSRSQEGALAPGAESPAAEAEEGEAVKVQALPGELPADGAGDLPEAEADQVVEVQPLPVELPEDAGEVLPEVEEEHAPLDGEAGEDAAPDTFVSPWLWSTVEEEASARPLNASPGLSPVAESAPGERAFTSPQPSPSGTARASRGALAHGDPLPPGDLEDGDGRWEGDLPEDPPGAWA